MSVPLILPSPFTSPLTVGLETVILYEAEPSYCSLSTVAVIVTSPSATIVTAPVAASTLAMLASLLVYVTFRPAGVVVSDGAVNAYPASPLHSVWAKVSVALPFFTVSM